MTQKQTESGSIREAAKVQSSASISTRKSDQNAERIVKPEQEESILLNEVQTATGLVLESLKPTGFRTKQVVDELKRLRDEEIELIEEACKLVF